MIPENLFITQFIHYISRYPSGDNCQPFSFLYLETQKVLEIYHNSETAKHELNPRNRSSVISLGAILELAKTCSYENNFEIQTEVLVNTSQMDQSLPCLWAKIILKTLPIEGILLGTLMKIKTNRGPYLKSDVDFQNNIVVTEASRIVFTKSISNNSKKLIIKMETLVLWKNNQVLKDLFTWLRLSFDDYKKSRTGFHYTELGMNVFEAVMIKSLRSFYDGKYLSSIPGLGFIAGIKSQKNLNKTDSFAVILSKAETLEDFLAMGAAFIRLKFFIAKFELESQPLSASTFPFIFGLNNIQEQTPKVMEVGHDLQEALRHDFKIEKDEMHAAWLIRIGRPVRSLESSLRKT